MKEPWIDTFSERIARFQLEQDEKREERQILKFHIRTECERIRDQQERLADILHAYEDIANTL